MPGVGKTTLSLEFLRAGAAQGQRVLYVTLSETKDEISQVADSHGWSLEGIDVYELSSNEQTLHLEDENTLYATEDVDLKEVIRVLLAEVERVKPSRVVFDSLSEIRLLAESSMRYRRQILALKQHFSGRQCTVLLLDDRLADTTDAQVESLAHGVIVLEQSASQYGPDRRRLRVSKLRGSDFRSGYHDFSVKTGGLVVFPRLIAAEHRSDLASEPLSTGIAALDAALGGGIDAATCTLLIGPAGTGKSALATQLAAAPAAAGATASLFLFEERFSTWRARSSALGIPVDALLASGRLHVHQIDPAELAPDEFTHLVRCAVVKEKAGIIVIDSIAGYFTAMPEARFLSLQMHELLSYLSERGVASIVTMTQAGIVGANMQATVDLSYLADTVVMLRHFEARGKLLKALSVVKKRSGHHENAIRELALSRNGITLGPPLTHVQGVFSGVPRLDIDEEHASP